MENVIVDNIHMKQEKNDVKSKRVRKYNDELISQTKVIKFCSNKKLARELFNNEIRVTRSYLTKFIKYYLYKSKYSYMKNDSRFNQKKYVDELMINLPTKKSMNRLEVYDYIADYFMNKSSNHMVFGDMASLMVVHKLHKTTSPSIKHVADKLYHNTHRDGTHSPLINDEVYEIIMKHHRKIQNRIVPERDYLFDYFGMKTLLRSYLFRYHRDGSVKIIERPQHLIMRVSLGIHGYDLDAAFETYDWISQRYFTHATPTLFNAGTPRAQMSSCFLNGVGDNIESIADLLKDIMFISKWSGGIGVHMSKIRSTGSLIKGTNGLSDGIVPLCQTINSIARYINQGGKRKGSVAVYLELWHRDIFEFIDLRSIKGSETLRARDLFLATWVSDLFMERVEKDEMWSLMCPNKSKGLSDVYGDEFKKLYTTYEKEGNYIKQVRAVDLMKHIMTQKIETGFPYTCYKDAANSKSNQKNLGTIKSSNLCAEIIEYSDENETAVCNLASICLPRFVREDENGKKRFDYDVLGEVTRVIVRNLNKVIDRNYYPTPKTKLSNMKHRPMGIGVQGLADLYNIMGYPYESKRARKLNKRVNETIYYYALDESKNCAKRHGRHYESYPGSPISQGILQWHMWGLKEEDLLMGLDWKKLLSEIKIHGVRNSLLIAHMPTASTSQIMGNSECNEPYMSNIFVRTTLAGNIMVVNKNFLNDMEKLGLWDEDMRKKLIIYNGSIQQIKEIPEKYKKIYKTAFEIKPKSIIDQSAERGPFICQSQSLNHFIKEPNYDVLYNILVYGHKRGLKTAMYYYRSQPAVNPIQVGIDVDDIKRLTGNDKLVDLIMRKNMDEDMKVDLDEKINLNKQSGPIKVEIEECLVCGS